MDQPPPGLLIILPGVLASFLVYSLGHASYLRPNAATVQMHLL